MEMSSSGGSHSEQQKEYASSHHVFWDEGVENRTSTVPFLIKADTQGTAEAVARAVEGLASEVVRHALAAHLL